LAIDAHFSSVLHDRTEAVRLPRKCC